MPGIMVQLMHVQFVYFRTFEELEKAQISQLVMLTHMYMYCISLTSSLKTLN